MGFLFGGGVAGWAASRLMGESDIIKANSHRGAGLSYARY